MREPKGRGQLRHSRKGLGGVGRPEIVKNDKIRKIHTPNIQGLVFFSEGAEAPQAAATQPQRAGERGERGGGEEQN